MLAVASAPLEHQQCAVGTCCRVYQRQHAALCGYRHHPWFTPGLPDYLAMPMPALGLHGLPPLPDPRVLGQLTTLGLDAQVRCWHLAHIAFGPQACVSKALAAAAVMLGRHPQLRVPYAHTGCCIALQAAAKAVQRRQHSPPAVAYHLLFDALQRRAGGHLVLPQAPTGSALPTGRRQACVLFSLMRKPHSSVEAGLHGVNPPASLPNDRCRAWPCWVGLSVHPLETSHDDVMALSSAAVPPVQRTPGSGQWLPGLPLRIAGGAAAAIAALLSALLAHSCAWKRTALYTYRCRATTAKGVAGGGSIIALRLARQASTYL
jgi:hypothetical protein